ncbi:MAG: hypothetical protein R3F43_24930 [bacterium]
MEVFSRVCSIVGYAHQRGIIHRDPARERPRRRVRRGSVVDWGIAVALAAAPSHEVAGTPFYMSPSRLRGRLSPRPATSTRWG